MPAPTSYTETTLKQFMLDELGSIATLFGLTTSSVQIINAITLIERLLGDAVADVTDLEKLEAFARWRAWHVARAAAVGQYDLASSGDSLKRSQIWDHLVWMLAEAEAGVREYEEAAGLLGGTTTAYVGKMVTAGNPYAWPAAPSGFD